MKKNVFLSVVAALAIASFACSSVPFLAHATKTAIPPTATSTARAKPTNTPGSIDTPEPTEEAPTDTTAPDNSCGGNEGESGKIQVRWFIGLGAGSEPAQVTVEQAVVDAFNASQDKIELVMEVFPYDSAKDVLSTQIAAGDGPDIIGPVGFGGSNTFQGQWLDIAPLIECTHYDSSQFDPALLSMYESSEGTVGLPFSVYPSLIFYNKNLFDQAGLSYPPSQYGDQYQMPDGSRVDWTWNTLGEVARRLTKDSNTRNATESGFNKNSITQYGFTWQYESHPSYWGSYWESGSMVAPGGSPGYYKAQVSEAWNAAWQWTYDGIWGTKPFMASESVEGSNPFNGNAFNSGKIAMTISPVWYTCCIANVNYWDAAAMPTYNGKVGGRIDADTFRIWKGTQHPQAAFTAMSYLVDEGIQKLIIGSSSLKAAYGGVPARIAYQSQWLAAIKDQFPRVKNWDVVMAGLDYPDVPSAEGYLPNFAEAWNRGNTFGSLLRSRAGLNLAQAIQTYASDLTNIFNK
jgi:multiple sugar transport system substrate-binding protein